jgi:hypothetical protein
MIRLIFWAVLLYFGWRIYHAVKNTLQENSSPKVEGEPTKRKFNIDEKDIEDADFKDLKE